MKNLILIFLLLFFYSAYAQQTIDRLNVNQLKLPKESSSKALILDSAGQVKSSSNISDTELGYLEGLPDTLVNLLGGKENTITPGTSLQYFRGDKTFQTLDKSAVGLSNVDNTSDINKPISNATQTALNAKADDSVVVKLTGNQSISGTKTFTGKLVASTTINGAIPCPVMNQTQRDAFIAAQGDCVYNSTSLQLNVYDGSLWKSAGGSGGISLWLTGTAYAINDVVIESDKIYRALVAHTSSTFATDLAALKWTEVSASPSTPYTLASGGTNKSLTAVNGGIVWVDSDSFEILSPGVSGQILQSNGSSSPSWVNKSISGKAQNVTAVTLEEMQVPNNLLTETGTNKYLNETGNTNLLANPSFEHSTYDTSWTLTAGSKATEGTKVVHGVAAFKATLSAQTLELFQNSSLYASQFAGTVQGLAMVRVNTAVAGIFVCSGNNTLPQLNNCVAVDSSGTWGLYKVPFILGSTNNGIYIVSGTQSGGLVTVGNVTGNVYVDDAFVGTANIIDTQPVIGPWTSYIPTFTGFGTVASIAVEWRQVGQNIEIRGKFTTGTGTATEGRISLPTGLTSAGTSSIPSLEVAGTYAAGFTSTNSHGGFFLKEPSVTYITIGAQSAFGSSSVNPITKVNGDNISTGVVVSFNDISVPIAEFSGSTSTYSSQCGANCVDEFKALVTTTSGTIASERTEFITSCTAANPTVCTLNAFTVTPYCEVSMNSTAPTTAHITALSATSITVESFNTTTGLATANQQFTLTCGKTGADFTASRTIVGSFKEVDVSTGISKPKICHYAFGGAAATLASPVDCTTGTCIEVVDTCGTGTPPAFASTGTYTNVTFASGTWSNSSYISCLVNAFPNTANATREASLYWDTGDQNWSTNASGGYVTNVESHAPNGAVANTFIQITCKGQAP